MKICTLEIDVPIGGATAKTSDLAYHGWIEKIQYEHVDACAETTIDFSTTGNEAAQGFLRVVNIGDADKVIYPSATPVDSRDLAISEERDLVRIDGKIVGRVIASCGACTVKLHIFIKEEKDANR